jgi:hypothetical protein
MTTDAYFAWVLIILSVMIFVALVLGFLYMVYGKEDTEDEEE